MQCSMAWALHRTEKEKPAAGKTDYWRDFWRSGWDSNPRNLAVQLISSQSRYDHFDTAPYLSQHQHLGKRGELMGRTSKNIKLRIPEKPRKIKGFRSGSYRVATTISSVAPSASRTSLQDIWLFLAQGLEEVACKSCTFFLGNGAADTNIVRKAWKLHQIHLATADAVGRFISTIDDGSNTA